MLYKKIHRQYVREFRVGREFEYKHEIFVVTGGPCILSKRIAVAIDSVRSLWYIIYLPYGRLRYKNDITWLD